MTSDKPVHIKLEGRRFIVRFGRDGDPQSIKERKQLGEGPFAPLADVAYWHKAMRPGGAETLPNRIVAAARQKLHNAALAAEAHIARQVDDLTGAEAFSKYVGESQ